MKRFVVAALLATAALVSQAETAQSMRLFPPNWLTGSHSAQGAPAPQQAPQATVQLAQQSSEAAKVMDLEQEIRDLNGRIEEMSYQLLQMQEQIRKYQEDNEFRFQDLEKGAGGGTKKSEAAPVDKTEQESKSIARIFTDPPADAGGSSSGPSTPQDTASANQTGAPERTLGTIELDANGMPVGTSQNTSSVEESALPGVDGGQAPVKKQDDSQQTAALSNENDVYQAAYGHVLSGDYGVAKTEFQDFIERFPDSKRAADANFWLGEALYSQGDYNEAAKTFLNAHQNYGSSPKAPEMLLKLGMSMAKLDNQDTACAIYREVGKRYPSASRAVLQKATSELKQQHC
ncbi:tol-pal system protein YbgF [Rhizobium halophytocola]|uniref:Cell division coordinator CpoB n=1 Tax=Rhizobium halophytocola TaxID=735519 RepID=A0ABS4DT61_9HYPH|nr:tol-pal system protein YbgF [Rhizobium halophytocola]MBP1848857.1 tol-pal system protein YbgF [Rhizobium halophytocola]